ncbi:hypothetical protein [Methanobrevibacter cuticularis]|uniref:hypothetical protein n=1 Tax=Methanobrevibacter cuticularis TaxID=47311 RepID=UPI001FDEF35B|nr:hypothetical protein [Methanobrevibacter cuticularis]
MITKEAAINDVVKVKLMANISCSEKRALINPSNEGIKNMLPITTKKIAVIAIVIPMKINSNLDRIFSTTR